jgi:hypothetical protein
MKRSVVAIVAACALVAGCGDDDNPTSPSNLPLVFTAQLSPANEVPPVGNAEGGGRGAVQVTFTPTRDASGAITSATAAFHVQLSGFPSGTQTVGAHIHSAGPGVNGPIVVNTGVSAASPWPLGEGISAFDVANITVTPATLNAIVANPAAFYFNVHSPLNPGGYARGQLQAVQ